MELRKIIATTIRKYINEQQLLKENIQLADKIYFKTGKLSDEDREIILNITNGNNYTKLIADFYYYFKVVIKSYPGTLIKELNLLYYDVLNYNKNVYPIIGYDAYNSTNISEIITAFKKRRKIINEIKKLPSIATRNLKNDIRKERTSAELNDYSDDLQYFMTFYALLGNRDKEVQIKILRKMFKGNTTLEELMRFVDEKANFIGGVDFTRDDIKELSESEDFEIIYEQGDIAIVRVDSPDGIKAIGCNSLWCFTYGSGFDNAYRQWNSYSHNDIVYVLIDFREESNSEDFMHVLISPLIDEEGNLIEYDEDDDYKYPLFNMSNENYSNPYGILKYLFGNNYENIIYNYLNFEY
jgi:hypothetical protein